MSEQAREAYRSVFPRSTTERSTQFLECRRRLKGQWLQREAFVISERGYSHESIRHVRSAVFRHCSESAEGLRARPCESVFEYRGTARGVVRRYPGEWTLAASHSGGDCWSRLPRLPEFSPAPQTGTGTSIQRVPGYSPGSTRAHLPHLSHPDVPQGDRVRPVTFPCSITGMPWCGAAELQVLKSGARFDHTGRSDPRHRAVLIASDGPVREKFSIVEWRIRTDAFVHAEQNGSAAAPLC